MYGAHLHGTQRNELSPSLVEPRDYVQVVRMAFYPLTLFVVVVLGF